MSRWGKSFKAALVFMVVFGLCGLLALPSLGGGPPTPAETRLRNWGPVLVGASGFLTALVMWWAIVGRARTAPIRRGLISGIASGVLIHPVCSCLVTAGNCLTVLLGVSSTDPLAEPLLTLGHEFSAVFNFSILSLLFFGWLTVVAGALTGGLLASWQDGGSASDGA